MRPSSPRSKTGFAPRSTCDLNSGSDLRPVPVWNSATVSLAVIAPLARSASNAANVA